MNKFKYFIRHKRTIRIFLLFLVISFGIYFFNAWQKGYIWQEWTGFSKRTLWEWLELLIIPATLAVVAVALEAFERKTDREIALENQRETILQNIFDALTRLILDKNLKGSKSNDEVREIARVKILTTLKSLDSKRKGILINFLSETNLIQKAKRNHPIISLFDANLTGANLSLANLKGTNLEGANLTDANLECTDLTGANLEGADLTGALLDCTDMIGANLNIANLTGTHLSFANLTGAYLYGANLMDAILWRANLKDAILRSAELSGAFLDNAIMPDGQKYDPSIHTIENLTGKKSDK